jgi:hypothetical protein
MSRRSTRVTGDKAATCNWNFIQAVNSVVFGKLNADPDVRRASRE